jgi:putative SOS response-associated peptidase YedK
MMGLAGLWERWKATDGSLPIDSFSIITTEANELAATVHTRMPVILEPQNYERWLQADPRKQPPVDLLRPLEADRMTAWKVDRRVGNVRNNEPALCDPLP